MKQPALLKNAALSLWLATSLVAAVQTDHTITAPAAVQSFFFTPDGHTLVTSCTDKHVHTYDVATGKATGDQAQAGHLLSSGVLWQPSDDRKSGNLWDLAKERQRIAISAPVSMASLSNNQQEIAASLASERTVRLFNAETGEQRRVMADGVGGAAALVFSPDDSTVVSANFDNDIRIWKTNSGELVRKIENLTGAMFAGAFTPDGTQLVLGGLDETVYIFDAKTYELTRTLKGHGETILALAISPDGRTLVTGGFDVTAESKPVKLVFWDLASGKIMRTVQAPHAVHGLRFSPDGSWLAMATVGASEVSLVSTGAGRGSGTCCGVSVDCGRVRGKLPAAASRHN